MKFEVGKSYEANDPGNNPIRILKRTEKTATVNNGYTTWRMRIRIDDNGDEYMIDSSVPRSWRDGFTYSVRWATE